MGGTGRVLKFFTVLMMFSFVGVPVVAADDTILTVISTTADGSKQKTEFTLRDITEVEQKTIVTTTPWTTGVQEFVGIACKHLFKDMSLVTTEYIAKALNDYSVPIPTAVLTADTCLIAYKRNGELMSVRDKGPLWIIFPYDQDERFQSSAYQSYSIWNLSSIERR